MASAKAVMTLRMVPSFGSDRAWRAVSAPCRMACPICSKLAPRADPMRSEMPVKNWARMAPELPRAPSMACSLTRRNSSPVLCALRLRAPVRMLPKVNAMLLPVSPSGTGNTLILLSKSRCEMTRRAPEIRARRNIGARISGAQGSMGNVFIRFSSSGPCQGSW